MNKIFCIGFNKTATVSLSTALRMLGFPGIHGMWSNHLKVQRAIDDNEKLLHYFSKNTCHFSDLDIIKDNFKILDEQYPNSKFILNTRDKESWLKSRINHLNDYKRNLSLGTNKYAKTWKWVNESENEWLQQWDNHHDKVIKYFKDNENFLIFNISKGDGYKKLCNFLKIPILNKPFPKKNVTK
jgi:hypothetical protein